MEIVNSSGTLIYPTYDKSNALCTVKKIVQPYLFGDVYDSIVDLKSMIKILEEECLTEYLHHGTVYLTVRIKEGEEVCQDIYNRYVADDNSIAHKDNKGNVYITTSCYVLGQNKWLDDLKYTSIKLHKAHSRRVTMKVITQERNAKVLNRIPNVYITSKLKSHLNEDGTYNLVVCKPLQFSSYSYTFKTILKTYEKFLNKTISKARDVTTFREMTYASSVAPSCEAVDCYITFFVSSCLNFYSKDIQNQIPNITTSFIDTYILYKIVFVLFTGGLCPKSFKDTYKGSWEIVEVSGYLYENSIEDKPPFYVRMYNKIKSLLSTKKVNNDNTDSTDNVDYFNNTTKSTK